MRVRRWTTVLEGVESEYKAFEGVRTTCDGEGHHHAKMRHSEHFGGPQEGCCGPRGVEWEQGDRVEPESCEKKTNWGGGK
jgi:hypothetical protein